MTIDCCLRDPYPWKTDKIQIFKIPWYTCVLTIRCWFLDWRDASCHALYRHRWLDEITMGGFEEGSCWLTTHVNLVILYPSVYLWQFQPSSSLEDGQIRKSSREQSPFSCQLITSSLKTQIWDERNTLPWKDWAWALRTT